MILKIARWKTKIKRLAKIKKTLYLINYILITTFLLTTITYSNNELDKQQNKNISDVNDIYERDIENNQNIEINTNTAKDTDSVISKTLMSYIKYKGLNAKDYYIRISNELNEDKFKTNLTLIKKPEKKDYNLNFLYFYLGFPYKKLKDKLHPEIVKRIDFYINEDGYEKGISNYFKHMTYDEIVIPIMLIAEDLKIIHSRYIKDLFWYHFFHGEITQNMVNYYGEQYILSNFISRLFIGSYNLDPRVRLICLNLLSIFPKERALNNYIQFSLTFETVGNSDTIIERLQYVDLVKYQLGNNMNQGNNAQYVDKLVKSQKYIEKFKGKEYAYVDVDGVYKFDNPYKLLFKVRHYFNTILFLAELENRINSDIFSLDKISKEDFYILIYPQSKIESNFWDRIRLSSTDIIISEGLKRIRIEDLEKLDVGDIYKSNMSVIDEGSKSYRPTYLTDTDEIRIKNQIIPVNLYYDNISAYSYFVLDKKEQIDDDEFVSIINNISKGLENKNVYIRKNCELILLNYYYHFINNKTISSKLINLFSDKFNLNIDKM